MIENIKILSSYCVLNIHQNVIYAAKGYSIYKSFDGGGSWELDGKIEDFKYGLIANTSRLLARLFRAEITNLIILQNGSRIITAKKGIFVASFDQKIYRKTFIVPRGSRPMGLCLDGSGSIYFGEYFSNPERDKVHIFKSVDSGLTWVICYTFPKKSIRHIHGIFYDRYEDMIWFSTGDLDGECIIGNTQDGFKNVNFVKKGGQQYRTVKLLFYKDFIVYGTDSEYEKNYIYRIDRKDYKEYCLKDIQSSVFSAVKVDEYAAISTAVEASSVNIDRYAHVWFSENGIEWKELFQFEKDFFHPKYFQVGRIKFPQGAFYNGELFSTGHALKGLDNSSLIYKISNTKDLNEK